MSEYLKTDTTTFGATPLIQGQLSTNPAAAAPASSTPSIMSLVVLGAFGIGGYLLYRHFKKNKGTTTPEGQ